MFSSQHMDGRGAAKSSEVCRLQNDNMQYSAQVTKQRSTKPWCSLRVSNAKQWQNKYKKTNNGSENTTQKRWTQHEPHWITFLFN
jgi:hypothetical protein